jgi:hypothetical protein
MTTWIRNLMTELLGGVENARHLLDAVPQGVEPEIRIYPSGDVRFCFNGRCGDIVVREHPDTRLRCQTRRGKPWLR